MDAEKAELDVEYRSRVNLNPRICCHDSKRIVPWTLFSSFVTLTVVLLVLFLVYEDNHHLRRGSSSQTSSTKDPEQPPAQHSILGNSSSALCGHRMAEPPHPGIDKRVSGGRPSSIESWPWMASLRDTRGTHFCGATLISDRWLLTAAHCVSAITTSQPLGSIVLGDTSLVDGSEYHVNRANFKQFPHPDFNASTFENDIALIRIDPPVPSSKGIVSACLNENVNEIDNFTKCYVAGWGATSYSDIRSSVLQEGRIPLVPLQNCTDAYKHRQTVTSQMLCAVSTDWQVDTCKGDSGGPLMCENPDSNKWSIIGVTSFGYGCWTPGRPAPGVYTRVSSYYSTFILPTVETDGER